VGNRPARSPETLRLDTDGVRLSDDEITELNQAVTRSRQRSEELRPRLAERPAGARTGEFVAETVARHAGAPEPDDALVRAAKSGDPRAREEMIERFMPLVVSLARSFRVEGLDFADVVQEGYVGLLRALERFDPDRGVPFAAYAIPWIRYSLQELRSDFMRPMRLPRQALRQLSQLKPEHDRIYAAERRDFEAVHRCGVLAAESRAGQYKYSDIEVAAAHLHGMLDELR
jgi:RNA polymerase sigma factor (sigma-70 family)